LIEAVVPLLNKMQEGSPVPPGQGGGGADGEGELWQALRSKCGELAALVLRAQNPREAAAYVLGYLPKHLECVFEQLFGRKRAPVLSDFQAVPPLALRNGKHKADPV
jgi:hypothetical protein